jgi:hypothetical protein
MAVKKPAKRGRGRPPKPDAMKQQINVRVDDELRAGIDAYRKKYHGQHNLPEMADAVRHMLRRILREEGL